MWRISADPWLRPVAGSLAVVDRPIDADRFRRRVRRAVADIARLRERVAPGAAPWDPPRWVPDDDFDLDYHLRHIALAGDGSEAELRDVASRWYEDPFDPARPLWQFVIVDGVEGHGGALFSKLHHSISDGIGLLRLSERYVDVERDPPQPPDLDLGIAEVGAGEGAGAATDGDDSQAGHRSTGPSPLLWPVTGALRIARLAGWPLGMAGRAVAQAASFAIEPQRAAEATGQVLSALRGAAGRSDRQEDSGSTSWGPRSARRRLEAVRVPLADLKAAAAALSGSVNDAFVTGAVNAVVAYQQFQGRDPEALNFSFVVSQRHGAGAGGNFFTPVRVHLPVPPESVAARLVAVRDAMAGRRQALQTGVSLDDAASLARLLPAAVLSRVARLQVGGLDFATSNLRGASFPLYISGARVLYNLSLGPLAGAPFNLTTVSYDGSLDMGLLVDPAAVSDPPALRLCLEDAYRQIIAAGS